MLAGLWTAKVVVLANVSKSCCLLPSCNEKSEKVSVGLNKKIYFGLTRGLFGVC